MMERLLTTRPVLLVFGFFILFASCSGNPNGRGTLEIRIKDHRAAIDDFTKLETSIESIRLKPRGSWIDITPDLASVDLTAYQNGKFATVFKGEIESGSFQGIHLKLGQLGGILKKGNSAAEVKSGVGPIQLPFSVEANTLTLLIIDLEVQDLTDHSQGGYELHIKGYEHFLNGKLIDRVPPG